MAGIARGIREVRAHRGVVEAHPANVWGPTALTAPAGTRLQKLLATGRAARAPLYSTALPLLAFLRRRLLSRGSFLCGLGRLLGWSRLLRWLGRDFLGSRFRWSRHLFLDLCRRCLHGHGFCRSLRCRRLCFGLGRPLRLGCGGWRCFRSRRRRCNRSRCCLWLPPTFRWNGGRGSVRRSCCGRSLTASTLRRRWRRP